LECALPSNELIANGRLHLIQHHFTTSRAMYFLDRLKKALCS
jgi:hypothetical protein